MKLEELKEIRKILLEDNIYNAISLIINAGLLLPSTYMFIIILLNEIKKDSRIPIEVIPYLTFIIFSSIMIDLNIDNINEKIR